MDINTLEELLKARGQRSHRLAVHVDDEPLDDQLIEIAIRARLTLSRAVILAAKAGAPLVLEALKNTPLKPQERKKQGRPRRVNL